MFLKPSGLSASVASSFFFAPAVSWSQTFCSSPSARPLIAVETVSSASASIAAAAGDEQGDEHGGEERGAHGARSYRFRRADGARSRYVLRP